MQKRHGGVSMPDGGNIRCHTIEADRFLKYGKNIVGTLIEWGKNNGGKIPEIIRPGIEGGMRICAGNGLVPD
jgi:hypothetical protein